MFPVGGVEVMLLGAALSGLLCVALGVPATRRWGWVTGWSAAGLLWSLTVIALVTLIPAQGAPGIIGIEERSPICSWDLGGPSPDGFWIFEGGQRLLNTVLFVPSGALLVVLAARSLRWVWVSVPVGVALLAGYSVAIELTQLELARLDRACDVTDMVDNSLGAVLGVGLGIVLAALLRPWSRRPSRPPSRHQSRRPSAGAGPPDDQPTV